jgi:glycosyltransferase involved in cell wall biosynthesis
MASDPKVSVVMIAYSALEYIPLAVESILDQEIEQCEIIVVDDGSPEDVEAVLAPYRARIQYIRRANGGPGAARDTGVEAARGEYVAFADSDDVHLPYRISCQAALLDAYPEAALTCSDFSTYVDGEVTEASTLRIRPLGVDTRDFEVAVRSEFGMPKNASDLGLPAPAELQESKVYCGLVPGLIAGRHIAWDGASMYRKSALESVGGHDPSMRYWEDWCLTSRLSKKYPIVYWDAPTLLYRQHDRQITRQSALEGARSYRDVVFRVWKDDARLVEEHPAQWRKMMKRATLRNASYATEAREYQRARKDILHFIRMAPLDRHGYTALARNIAQQSLLDRIRR